MFVVRAILTTKSIKQTDKTISEGIMPGLKVRDYFFQSEFW